MGDGDVPPPEDDQPADPGPPGPPAGPGSAAVPRPGVEDAGAVPEGDEEPLPGARYEPL